MRLHYFERLPESIRRRVKLQDVEDILVGLERELQRTIGMLRDEWVKLAKRIKEIDRLLVEQAIVQILSQDHSGFGVWFGDPFHDKESEQFVARYIERAPLSLEKLSITDFAEATSGHFRRREGPAKASMATAGKTTSSHIKPKTAQLTSLILWSFLQHSRRIFLKPTSLLPDTMEGTHVDVEVSGPSTRSL